ncbi:hypothetical protein [Metamycoplasma equirhinis]|uniref:hypothetical protein n=1 Tax=Metamycoplasma equirhinis TaxID=92402 RepID=UPI0035931ECC
MKKIENFFSQKNTKTNILYYLVASIIAIPTGIISLLASLLLKPYIKEGFAILITIVQIIAIGIILFLIISLAPIYKDIKQKYKKSAITLFSIIIIFAAISLILLVSAFFINSVIKAYKNADTETIKNAISKINALKLTLISATSIYVALTTINSGFAIYIYIKTKREYNE